MAKQKKRDLSKEYRKPHRVRWSDQEWAEITAAAESDGITCADVVRPASLIYAKEISQRHRARD